MGEDGEAVHDLCGRGVTQTGDCEGGWQDYVSLSTSRSRRQRIRLKCLGEGCATMTASILRARVHQVTQVGMPGTPGSVRILDLRDAGGGDLPDFAAGAHIDLTATQS
jgi:hypothetical protein